MLKTLEQKTVTPLMINDTVELLRSLVKTPALSGKEGPRADIVTRYLLDRNVIKVHRKGNNIWAFNMFTDPCKPTILLNSHLDTVAPNAGYTKDPFNPEITDGKLFGLGSNDAGASLVCLINTFLHFYKKPDLPFNLLLSATAEEEISGKNGIELIYPELGEVSLAIVGEPTEMHVAIAEKGLLVVDCEAKGIAGHAARDIGKNAIYEAIEDINWIRNYQFEKESPLLGKVRMSVNTINAGKQHNMIPDRCSFTIDIRLTEQYSHEAIIDLLGKNLRSEIRARSTRIRPSIIAEGHPAIIAATKIGRNIFSSATTSDQALIPAPSIKMGPGDSTRSHTSDEFILLSEIEEGLKLYIELLNTIRL